MLGGNGEVMTIVLGGNGEAMVIVLGGNGEAMAIVLVVLGWCWEAIVTLYSLHYQHLKLHALQRLDKPLVT